MTTKQPRWRRIANLGDANPVEYGGYFIYTDLTGVYAPEAEYLSSPESDDAPEGWDLYRVVLDRCTFIDGVLSDNRFHPEMPAWFADSIPAIARTNDQLELELIADLCSDDAIRRAWAYHAIASYHGWENFDSYPRHYMKRSELPRRIRRYNGR